uniref:Uncharacterized protein n=1 Tax=Myotis myotis TaxID=51298 RepID=A0A7J7RVA1_MYOMY|nr:hypothetical protein mMyoMyo1_010123 [Myotis myotis]
MQLRERTCLQWASPSGHRRRSDPPEAAKCPGRPDAGRPGGCGAKALRWSLGVVPRWGCCFKETGCPAGAPRLSSELPRGAEGAGSLCAHTDPPPPGSLDSVSSGYRDSEGSKEWMPDPQRPRPPSRTESPGRRMGRGRTCMSDVPQWLLFLSVGL